MLISTRKVHTMLTRALDDAPKHSAYGRMSVVCVAVRAILTDTRTLAC